MTDGPAWGAGAFVLLTQDPIVDPVSGFRGAALMGLASGLTVAPLAWLAVYARHRRIAYRGDWFTGGDRVAIDGDERWFGQ